MWIDSKKEFCLAFVVLGRCAVVRLFYKNGLSVASVPGLPQLSKNSAQLYIVHSQSCGLTSTFWSSESKVAQSVPGCIGNRKNATFCATFCVNATRNTVAKGPHTARARAVWSRFGGFLRSFYVGISTATWVAKNAQRTCTNKFVADFPGGLCVSLNFFGTSC